MGSAIAVAVAKVAGDVQEHMKTRDREETRATQRGKVQVQQEMLRKVKEEAKQTADAIRKKASPIAIIEPVYGLDLQAVASVKVVDGKLQPSISSYLNILLRRHLGRPF